jgi:hypothetical protein
VGTGLFAYIELLLHPGELVIKKTFCQSAPHLLWYTVGHLSQILEGALLFLRNLNAVLAVCITLNFENWMKNQHIRGSFVYFSPAGVDTSLQICFRFCSKCPILYIQRRSTALLILGCYWPCRNPCLFEVELATNFLDWTRFRQGIE